MVSVVLGFEWILFENEKVKVKVEREGGSEDNQLAKRKIPSSGNGHTFKPIRVTRLRQLDACIKKSRELVSRLSGYCLADIFLGVVNPSNSYLCNSSASIDGQSGRYDRNKAHVHSSNEIVDSHEMQ